MITEGATKVMECFGIKRGESVVIVVDTLTPPSIGASLFESAKNIGCEVILLTMQPRSRHGEEPPKAVAEVMLNADVVIAPTTFSITHTQAKINACKAGARIASMPGITEKMMKAGGITADCRKLKDIALRWHQRLEKVREVRIVSESGTDIVFDLEGCTWMMDTGLCHEKGCSSNLPAGEMFIAPRDANGVYVVDGSFSGFGLLDSPLEIEVRNRYVTSIKGEHARKLEKVLDGVGEKARNIAELGIGINPEAKLIGNVLEDEKVGGTVHLALGDNSCFGGNVIAGIHLDGIIKEPVLFLDGKKITEKI